MAPLVVRPEPVDLADFSFSDQDGGTKSLKDFAGKVVLMNIWATWCVPCREEMPALVKFVKETKGDPNVEFLAVSVDEDWKVVDAWLKERGIEAYVIHP